MQLLCEVNDKMKKFNNETAGYKDLRIYKAFKTFFDAYLVERDYDKTLSFMEEDFYSFGTGGDEYVLFLYDYDSEKELIKAIESLQYIQNHNAIHIDKNKDISVRFSMGYSLVNGCTDYQKLLKEADEKMYQNKLERRKIHSRL